MTQDYYHILGVRYDASKQEIRQAYLKLARQYHPDLNKEREAEELVKSINQAYNALTNDETRALYDQDLDIPPPWMTSYVRAALVLVCLGLSGVLTWYGFSLQNPDLVAARPGQGASPSVAKIGPSPKSVALGLPKGSVASKTVASPKSKAADKQNTVSIAPLKIASVSQSWNKPWRAKNLAFGDSKKRAKSGSRKSISEQSALLKASSTAITEREPQRAAMSKADQRKLMANLPLKTLSYRASPSEILSTIPIPMEDGTTIPANALLQVDTRIWNWKRGAFRKKLSKFINALIVSRDVEWASEESGLSMNEVRYFAKQVNPKQVNEKDRGTI